MAVGRTRRTDGVLAEVAGVEQHVVDARLQGAQEEVGVVDARRDHDGAARQELLVLAAVGVGLQVLQVPVRAVLLRKREIRCRNLLSLLN